jgi:hypothetical protein
VSSAQAPDLLDVDEALTRLEQWDERKGKIIELRYFGGMSREEIATACGLTTATVKRDLRLAEAWKVRRQKVEIGRWSLVEELFHEAADLAPAARAAYLDRVCGGDEDLRRQVASLLAADTPEDEYLQAAVDRAVDQLPSAADESWEPSGTRIGRYLITGLIGKGGMGAVYRAAPRTTSR